MEVENWRYVPGHYPYEVSDLGKVRRGRRYLKPQTVTRYLHVALYSRGLRTQIGIHTLVLLAFVGPKPNGYAGLHKDDDGHNNQLANLYWGYGIAELCRSPSQWYSTG